MRRFLLCIALILLASTTLAQEVADRFQFPLENYRKGTNGFKSTIYYGPPVLHLGEDAIATATTPVYAPANGTVRKSGYIGGYGGCVLIDHLLLNGQHVVSLLGHMNVATLTKKAGDPVRKGEFLGRVGTKEQNGNYSEHLHFGIRNGPYDSGAPYYVFRTDSKVWAWVWPYLGYSNNANTTVRKGPPWDITHDSMAAQWSDPSNFVTANLGAVAADIPYPEGTVIKFTDSPKVYLHWNKQLWHIKDGQTYALLGYNTGDCKTADFSRLVQLPPIDRDRYQAHIRGEIIPSVGMVVRIYDIVGPRTCSRRDTWRSSNSVYAFDGINFRPILNEAVYLAIGYKPDWSDLTAITQDLFNSYGESLIIDGFEDISWFAAGGDTSQTILPPTNLKGEEVAPGQVLLTFDQPAMFRPFDIRVIRDGRAILRGPATDAILLDIAQPPGLHEYRVSTVINGTNEESAPSDPVMVTVTSPQTLIPSIPIIRNIN